MDMHKLQFTRSRSAHAQVLVSKSLGKNEETDCV